MGIMYNILKIKKGMFVMLFIFVASCKGLDSQSKVTVSDVYKAIEKFYDNDDKVKKEVKEKFTAFFDDLSFKSICLNEETLKTVMTNNYDSNFALFLYEQNITFIENQSVEKDVWEYIDVYDCCSSSSSQVLVSVESEESLSDKKDGKMNPDLSSISVVNIIDTHYLPLSREQQIKNIVIQCINKELDTDKWIGVELELKKLKNEIDRTRAVSENNRKKLQKRKMKPIKKKSSGIIKKEVNNTIKKASGNAANEKAIDAIRKNVSSNAANEEAIDATKKNVSSNAANKEAIDAIRKVNDTTKKNVSSNAANEKAIDAIQKVNDTTKKNGK